MERLGAPLKGRMAVELLAELLNGGNRGGVLREGWA